MNDKPTDIVSQLRRDEGEVLHGYFDHLGFMTIGVGRLIDPKRGGHITREESAYLLANDIREKSAQLDEALPWWTALDEVRRGVLLNMAFQMGVSKLTGFVTTLTHIQAGDYQSASITMQQSQWAKQTPERAARLALQTVTGAWQ